MNKNQLIFFCLSFLLLFSFNSYSQRLTFDDLKYLLEHNIEDADNYVTKKGFRFEEVKKCENSECIVIIWVTHNIHNKEVLIKFYDEPNPGYVIYGPSSKSTYDNIKNYCQTIGFKFKKTEVNPNNELVSTYESQKYRIDFNSCRIKEKNIYSITLEPK